MSISAVCWGEENNVDTKTIHVLLSITGYTERCSYGPPKKREKRCWMTDGERLCTCLSFPFVVVLDVVAKSHLEQFRQQHKQSSLPQQQSVHNNTVAIITLTIK